MVCDCGTPLTFLLICLYILHLETNCVTAKNIFKVFPCSLSSCFVIPFSIVIIWLGEEGAGLCASLVFVCLFYTC